MAGDMREKYESLSLAILRDVAKTEESKERPPCGKKL